MILARAVASSVTEWFPTLVPCSIQPIKSMLKWREPIRTRAILVISGASNFKYHSCLMFIQLETKHGQRTKPTSAAGKYPKMKRRLQDISNQDGFDESHSGKTSPEIRRRRVAMEKRRRDKINEYLDELSQLVPEAAEKVGFTKLEKAEVLEMTVNYVKRLIKERKGTAQTIDLDPEMERKRGFLTCMSHIKSYLEDHNWPLSKKETAEPKLDYQPYSSGPTVVHSELPRTAGSVLYASEPTTTSSASGQQNVFNKICLDFLKNSSSSVPSRSAEKQQIVDSVPWQQQTGWQENSTDLRSNISENVDDFDLRYGSFMSAINGP